MFDGAVYIVLTWSQSHQAVSDLEVLDEMPKWDWMAQGQQVYEANINGGDSVLVEMPKANVGRG